MAELKYVMNETERKLYDLIDQDGFGASISALVRAVHEYGHNMSDLGIKDKSYAAFDLASLLQDIRAIIEE